MGRGDGAKQTKSGRTRWLRSATLSVACVALALSGMNCPHSPLLRAAACQRDITPISPGLAAAYEAAFGETAVVNHTDPVFLAGFGDNRQATGYNDRLWARGVVMDGSGGRIAIVALDLVGYFNQEVETIRSLVDPASAVDYVVVHSTHQHEGPDTLGIWGPDPLTSGADPGYLDFVNDAVASCIDEAAANLEPARVKFATTDSIGLSLGIDAEDDGDGVADGKVLVDDDLISPATDGRITNPMLSIMQVEKLARGHDALATLVSFASHPESLGSNNTLVTSDFPHYARETIEAAEGGMAIWVSGDLGVLQGPLDIDVLDPDTGSPAVRRTFRWAEVHGQQLGERVVSAIPSKPGHPLARIEFASAGPVPVRLDNPYFRFFLALGVLPNGLFTGGVPDDSVGFPFPPPFDSIPQALGADLHSEVGAFRINEASFAVVPSELDPQIGDVYRDAMTGAEHTFIIGLGNDEIGYQLPAEKWDDSCHACAPFVLAGVPELCPLFPNIDCNTVFQNNVGAEVDPTILGRDAAPALEPARLSRLPSSPLRAPLRGAGHRRRVPGGSGGAGPHRAGPQDAGTADGRSRPGAARAHRRERRAGRALDRGRRAEPADGGRRGARGAGRKLRGPAHPLRAARSRRGALLARRGGAPLPAPQRPQPRAAGADRSGPDRLGIAPGAR